MAYRVEVGAKASTQLSELDPTVGSGLERKIIWLAQNAAATIHRRLVGMPDDLAGLCKITSGRLAHSLLDLSRRENCAYL
jgi:hypothetical protein